MTLRWKDIISVNESLALFKKNFYKEPPETVILKLNCHLEFCNGTKHENEKWKKWKKNKSQLIFQLILLYTSTCAGCLAALGDVNRRDERFKGQH